jgi:hypothetical protein
MLRSVGDTMCLFRANGGICRIAVVSTVVLCASAAPDIGSSQRIMHALLLVLVGALGCSADANANATTAAAAPDHSGGRMAFLYGVGALAVVYLVVASAGAAAVVRMPKKKA